MPGTSRFRFAGQEAGKADARLALRRVRVAGAMAMCLAGGLGGFAGTVHAAGPGALCPPESAPNAAALPADAALRARAATLEDALARGAPLGDLAAALDMPDSGADAPSPEALATYCVAAGEAARTSSQGSQFQAHSYLLAAFRNAELYRQPELSA